MTSAETSPVFITELFAILATCRVTGWIFLRFLKQPQVVGEMVAGVMLGPSLLGAVAPGLGAWLFTTEARTVLYTVAQLGIGLYMFIVGLGFRKDHFRENIRSATPVSLFGMSAPFFGASFIAHCLSAWGAFSGRT